MLDAVIDRGLHDHSVAARIGTVDRVSLDGSPFAGRTPIPTELGEGVAGVFRGMLLPIRISEPDPVGILEVLVLECGKEFIGSMTFRIVAEMVSDPYQC